MNSSSKHQEDECFTHPFFVKDLTDQSALDVAVAGFRGTIEDFETKEHIEIRASSYAFADLIRAFSRDIVKLIVVDSVNTPSSYRIAGLLTFWIRKLKPLQDIKLFKDDTPIEEQEKLRILLNEAFALNVGISEIASSAENAAAINLQSILSSKSYTEILTHLRYRAISPQAMSVMYEMLIDIRIAQEETVVKLLAATEYRDNDTGQHVKRVGKSSALLAEKMGWREHGVKDLYFAAMMHDIGKIAIPDKILRKRGELDAEEFEEMKIHTIKGSEILDHSISPLLVLAKEISLGHHERWDGAGYPNGLRGENIPESARIVSITDAFDAMMSNRIYREGQGKDYAINELQQNKGKQFDPELCDMFVDSCLDEILPIYSSAP